MTRHDKHVLPEWLEEELRDIDSLIGILDAAKQSAFSLTSSPVGDLVSLLVDLLMRIKNSYEHGVADFTKNNPEIVFLDEQPMGPLGNSMQRTIKFDRKLNWSLVYKDPTTSPMPVFLKASARFFSRSLTPTFNFQESFHDFLKELSKFLPPGVLSQKSIQAEKNNKITSAALKKGIRAKKAQNAYYRRRRQRK